MCTTQHAELLVLSSPAQAWMPSSHVCSKFESPALPQFWNQLPPEAQHVALPALLVTHSGHLVEAGVTIVATAVCTYKNIGKECKKDRLYIHRSTSGAIRIKCIITFISYELTCADLETLVPRVLNVRVARWSTVLKPTSSGSATRGLSGLVGHALRTRSRGISSYCCNCCVCMRGYRSRYNATHTTSQAGLCISILPRAYICRPGSPRTTCGQNLGRRHLHISGTNCLRERNTCVYRRWS